MSKVESTTFFSFSFYRHDLSRLLDKFSYIIEDTTDFWKFVQKYEDVERKKTASSNFTKSSTQKFNSKYYNTRR